MKKKFICTVCGYIHEGTEAPEQCPICKADKSKFKEMEVTDGELKFATVHYLGAAYKEGVSEELIQHCKETFAGECSEVGMYLAMARQADREGYPEIARAYEHYAYEEANHASRYAELLGEVLADTTTLSMTLSTKWLRMKLAMQLVLPVFIRDFSSSFRKTNSEKPFLVKEGV